jgi:hypothetical protein
MVNNKNLRFDAFLAGLLFLTALLMMMLSSCKHEPEILPINLTGNNGGGNNGSNNPVTSTCDPDSVYFESQVLPLLVSNCAKSGCHSVQDHEDGVVLNNYANVMATGDVDPGRPGNSDLYKVLIENDPDDRMPLDLPPLSPAQIDLVYRWIAQGAQNNSCSNTCDTTNVTYSGTISPIIQTYCVGCHSGQTPGGNIMLTTYSGVNTIAMNGKLSGSVNHNTGFSAMPKGGNKLAPCQIDQIRIWINNGAPNN